MGTRVSPVIAIIVVNATIVVLQLLVKKLVPTIGNSGLTGIYLILLPIGFGLFGWDVEYSVVAPVVLLGLALLLYSMKKQAVAARGVD